MKRIITTVGTSIFTNYQKDNTDLNCRIEDLKLKLYEEWGDWEGDIESMRKMLLPWLNRNSKSSAEIKSILKLKEQYGEIKVYLIATDTILSPLAAEIIKEFLEQKNIETVFDRSKDIISGLQVEDKGEFIKVGLSNLIERLKNLMGGSPDSYKDTLIFNITGGYKAIIPYMTIMGQIYEIPICYIFEETDELIEIPQAPMDFDFSIIDDNYNAFRFLKKQSPISYKEFLNDPGKEVLEKLKEKNLIESDSGNMKLTPLGILLVKRYEDLFNSGKYHKQNLISMLIELKLFKYFVKKYGNDVVEQGKKVGEKNYDIDIYIENGEKITAIEVKSGGNVPIWEDRAGSIEHKLTKGGFDYLLKNHNGKKLKLEVILYHPKGIDKSVLKQIGDLHRKYPEKTKSLKWYWLKIPDNYSTNTHWDVSDEKLERIYP